MTPIRIKMCFLMDCTASMELWIQAAKNEITRVISETQMLSPNTVFTIAFVGYRDYGDHDRMIVHSFMDASDLLEIIRDVHADGGFDCAEDVAGGLQKVVQLDWNDAEVRSVIHIADAPPHGERFHAPYISDRYPNGDPDGVDPLAMVQRLSALQIDYTCIKINNSTDTMLELFHNSYAQGGEFRVADLTPQVAVRTRDNSPPRYRGDTLLLSPALTRSITASVERYTASQDPSVE